MVNRIHVIKLKERGKVTTHCGLVGFVDHKITNEFDTSLGGRFEAMPTNKGANCKRCQKGAAMYPRDYREDESELPGDSVRQKEKMPSGSEVDVTRRRDGTSTYHFGGPVGDVHYNQNGEEC